MYPAANRQRESADALHQAREERVALAEEAGRAVVEAKRVLLEAQKLAKAEATGEGITSAAGQRSYAEDRTIAEQHALDVAQLAEWAAKKSLESIVDRGEDLRSVAATMRLEMKINEQGGQP